VSERTAAAFYDRWAAAYDRLATDAPFVCRLRRTAVRALAPRGGDVVVEMGCGTGANFRALRDRVGPTGRVIGVDVSRGVLDRARDRIDRAGWRNVEAVRGDATAPPFAGPGATDDLRVPAGEVDAVFAAFVAGMLPDPAGAVDAWARLVGDGGRLGLLNLARATRPLGRPLNPAFRLLVRAGAPPGARGGEPPADRLDRRVRAAHRRLDRRCEAVARRRRLAGFARITAGTVAGGGGENGGGTGSGDGADGPGASGA